MKRIKARSLLKRNDKYYYQEKLFTGVAFELYNGEVKSMTNYKDGLPTGNYINEYFPKNKYHLHINDDLLEEDNTTYSGEPYSYKGEIFSGIAYEFVDDICIRENICLDGFFRSEVVYFLSGKLRKIKVNEEGLFQQFIFDENNEILKMNFVDKGSINATFEFTENHEISKIVLNGDYFENISHLMQKLKFPIFEHKSFINDINFADNLYLSGLSVDDEIFANLISNNSIDKIKTLFIYNTSITEKSLYDLKSLNNLKDLRVKNENDSIILSILQELKTSNPDLSITLNDEKVTA